MVELAMNLDSKKHYLPFKKVVLVARSEMFYFAVLFWNVIFLEKSKWDLVYIQSGSICKIADIKPLSAVELCCLA